MGNDTIEVLVNEIAQTISGYNTDDIFMAMVIVTGEVLRQAVENAIEPPPKIILDFADMLKTLSGGARMYRVGLSGGNKNAKKRGSKNAKKRRKQECQETMS